MLRVWLNNKAVGLGKPDKTIRKIGLLCAVFNSDELAVLNIISANKVAYNAL